jgi:hypothetical protein
VIARDVEHASARLLEDSHEMAVSFEVRFAALVLDRIPQVDEELGLFVAIQALHDRAEELGGAVRELAELALVVRGGPEVDVRNERKTHEGEVARVDLGGKGACSLRSGTIGRWWLVAEPRRFQRKK